MDGVSASLTCGSFLFVNIPIVALFLDGEEISTLHQSSYTQ